VAEAVRLEDATGKVGGHHIVDVALQQASWKKDKSFRLIEFSHQMKIRVNLFWIVEQKLKKFLNVSFEAVK
jgi:hypothetical protein